MVHLSSCSPCVHIQLSIDYVEMFGVERSLEFELWQIIMPLNGNYLLYGAKTYMVSVKLMKMKTYFIKYRRVDEYRKRRLNISLEEIENCQHKHTFLHAGGS